MEQGGGFVNRPPLLDGSNYDYWKSRMCAFLKSLDARVWIAILAGWEHPVVVDIDGKKTEMLKPELEWSKEEQELSTGNSKALNALFNGVDRNMFRLIKQCVTAKEAWEILQTVHEGTSKVKMSRLQLLTTKFENLKMKEDESVHDFYMNILDMANSFDVLGEKMTDAKLVRKILRSLPKRFDMKVTAIEEAQDINTMKVDELIGSLQTFEIAFSDRGDKKKKCIAFMSNTDDGDSQENIDEDDGFSEALSMVGRKFKQAWKEAKRSPRPNGPNIRFNISTQLDNQKRVTSDDEITHPKGVQCHECEGYGHIRSECSNYLKRQKKSLVVSWSDEDDSEGDIESTRHVIALTGVCTSDTKSCDGDLTYDELLATYKELYEKDIEICKTLHKQKKTINQLMTERDEGLTKIAELADEVTQLNSQLESMKKQVRMLNTSTIVLDEILEGQNQEKPKAIGYDYRSLNKRQQNKENKFVPAENEFDPTTVKPMLKHSPKHHASTPRRRSRRWVCHHCGRKGHIRPFCFKLHGYPKWYQQGESEQPKPKAPQTKKEWKPKSEEASLIAHTSLRVSSREDWYFDSGCSRHMTGVDKFLVDVKSYATSFVTFGDGAKGEIIGIGNLINNGLPRLNNVLLVRGLNANLISISQLCDQGMKVNFTQSECEITNEEGEILMRGTKSKDNCYLWVPQNEEAHLSSCLLSTEDEIKLWHQKHDSTAERVSDVEDNVETSSQQTYVPDKESNIELGGIDCEDSKANIVSSIKIQKNHLEEKIIGCCDANLARSDDDRNNSVGGSFLDDNNLLSWFNKKQNCMGLSTAKFEYIDAGNSCAQLLLMKHMLKEHNVEQDVMTSSHNNVSASNVSKNPIQHSIGHHFIRELVEDKVVNHGMEDIYIKVLDCEQFEKSKGYLCICLYENL
jgi:hypothetical protein